MWIVVGGLHFAAQSCDRLSLPLHLAFEPAETFNIELTTAEQLDKRSYYYWNSILRGLMDLECYYYAAWVFYQGKEGIIGKKSKISF
jgi:hypothetical protein